MALGLILGVVILVLAIAGLSFGSTKYKKSKKDKLGLAGLIFGGIMAVMFAIVPLSFKTVDTGEVAVVKHLGKAKQVRTSGTYFDFWLTNKYETYDTKVQNIEIITPAYSKDAQTMDLAITVQYQIVQEEVIDVAKNYGKLEVLENRIKSIAIEKTKAVLTSYSAMEIIENRSSISPSVEKTIKEAVTGEYHVDIVTVVLTNIDFSDAFEQIVESKMIAEQEKLKAQYEKETAIVNAEKELEVAKLAAQAKIEEAKAKAESEVEIAKAQAMATKLKSIEVARALGFEIVEEEIVDEETQSTSMEYTINFDGKSAQEIALITEYMKYIEYLSKWDGKLPEVMADDSAKITIPIVK